MGLERRSRFAAVGIVLFVLCAAFIVILFQPFDSSSPIPLEAALQIKPQMTHEDVLEIVGREGRVIFVGYLPAFWDEFIEGSDPRGHDLVCWDGETSGPPVQPYLLVYYLGGKVHSTSHMGLGKNTS